MARRHISQRDAWATAKRLEELEHQIERQRSQWSQEFVRGAEIARAKWESADFAPVAIRTARKLGHAVVCVADDSGLVRFVALPIAKGDA